MRKRRYTSLCASASGYDGSMPFPVIHNIVATSQIKCSVASIDLEKINSFIPFSNYDRNKFAAITIRLSNPDCTALLFSSGTLVVTGSRTWFESVYSSLFIAKILEECMPEGCFRLVKCDVQNIVAHVELGLGSDRFLNIKAMYARFSINCTYQKKMFPGLIFRPTMSPIVLLCFFSGKIVITGGKTMTDIFDGWSVMWPVVREFVVFKDAQ